MTADDHPTIRDWTRECSREPTLRVGVVLDADAMTSIDLDIPGAQYRLTCETGQPTTLQGVRLAARMAGAAVAIRPGDQPERTAAAWRLAPSSRQPLCRGQGVLVPNVIAGRGFHWQKRMDQTLCGAIELRCGTGGLLLINELPLERYLAGVITSEMSGDCPENLLKAQCVVARSWLLAMSEPKHDSDPFDRCNDDCCQRYQGTSDLSARACDAAEVTRGIVLTDQSGNVVDANYSKCCGGISESPESVWGRSKPGLAPIVDAPIDSPDRRFFPVTQDNLDAYLAGSWLGRTNIYCSPNVVPPSEFNRYLGRVDDAGSYFRWTAALSREELESLVKDKLPEASTLARLWNVVVTQRGQSGRASEIEIHFDDTTGRRRLVRVRSEYRIRQVLHSRFLYSSAFALDIERDAQGWPTTFTLRGAGWGHGAGLCQIGALGMALTGIGYERICRHYFPGATLKRVYD